MRHHCLARSGSRLTGQFSAAQMSLQVGQRKDQSVGFSRHLGNVGLERRCCTRARRDMGVTWKGEEA